MPADLEERVHELERQMTRVAGESLTAHTMAALADRDVAMAGAAKALDLARAAAEAARAEAFRNWRRVNRNMAFSYELSLRSASNRCDTAG